ncbi:MAG TPA: ATP-grasp fold amidoligase family protein [Acidimicrobiales bacterium]|nr:ATP-grasp fold amidoligase family protein [Acidimicrobiales bacterium]
MGSDRGLRARARALAFSPHVPFELRSRLFFSNKRRAWPQRHAVTFSEKLLWKMAKDRRPLLTTFADKVAVRDYVASAVGPEVLTALYAVVDDPADLDPSALPDQFVVKPNHTSGTIWIVDNTRPEEGVVQLSSEMFRSSRQALDWDALVAACRRWLSIRYADFELEWAYRGIQPKILVEELLVDPHEPTPLDYKFYVLNGRTRLLEVHMNRFGERRCNLVRPDWTPVEAKLPCASDPNGAPRPASLDKMLHIAETLGQDTDFVRVDLYDIDGRIVFGELTNYPGGLWGPGDPPFSPHEFNVELGGYWRIPKRYR